MEAGRGEYERTIEYGGRRLVVPRQGEFDYSCGAYCIVTAAMALGVQGPGWEIWSNTLSNLRKDDADSAGGIERQLFTQGLWDNDLHALARSAGLRFERIRKASFANLAEASVEVVHIAFLRMNFGASPKPRRGGNKMHGYEDWHYVLVLDTQDGRARVVDSHPSHPHESCIPEAEFVAQWRPKPGGCWLASLMLLRAS